MPRPTIRELEAELEEASELINHIAFVVSDPDISDEIKLDLLEQLLSADDEDDVQPLIDDEDEE